MKQTGELRPYVQFKARIQGTSSKKKKKKKMALIPRAFSGPKVRCLNISRNLRIASVLASDSSSGGSRKKEGNVPQLHLRHDCDPELCPRKEKDMKQALGQQHMKFLQPARSAQGAMQFKIERPIIRPYVDPNEEVRCRIKKDCLDIKTGKKQEEERKAMKQALIDKEKAEKAAIEKERESGK